MEDTAENIIIEKIAKQKAFFSTQQTKDVNFRLSQLRKLKQAILQYKEKIEAAFWTDLHKSPEEVYLTETSIVVGEIDNHIKNLKKWAKPERAKTPMHLLPSSSKIIYEPLGTTLIVAPWNYPFQLLINPLVGCISAGCNAILKPSPSIPTISSVIEDMIEEHFDPEYITTVHGGRKVNSVLFSQQDFDMIFFTGSPDLGKVVRRAASEHLTPTILELGGKSPCIVDAEADINVTAKRIVWGKLINAGQTCVAPDYLFVHHTIKDELLKKMVENIQSMFGEDIKQSRFYPRIVSDSAMERLIKLLDQGTIYTGGEFDLKERFIAPTIIDDVQPDYLVMQEEIFGPILPVMTFKHIDETIEYINKMHKPLALYYFGKKQKAKKVLSSTTSGGTCINDVVIHVSNHNLPFGGVGNSGIGKYHGKDSFLSFSNKRAVFETPTWIDLPFKYVPFKNFKLVKKIIG
ncbi:MAG: aldehyde dehydrogenase [Flavobacteriales bacterium]